MPADTRGTRRARAVVVLLPCLLFVLPLVFMVTGSLRSLGQPPPRTPELVPSPVAVDNYAKAFELVDLAHQLRNSLIVVAIAVPLTVLVASLAGYAMTTMSRRAGGVLVAMSFVTLMVPATALIVSRLALFRAVGATDTFIPLVAPALQGTSPFYVLLFYWSLRRIPTELYEAAALEGASPFSTWWRVAMPLVRPITVAVGVLALVVTWSNFLDPLIYLSDPDRFTVPLGLKQLSQVNRADYPLFLAGAVAATAPVIAVFIYVQRYFLGEFRRAGWLGR
jgi:multiple sugar transport system permease protein